jgi:hypothetical protein
MNKILDFPLVGDLSIIFFGELHWASPNGVSAIFFQKNGLWKIKKCVSQMWMDFQTLCHIFSIETILSFF